MISENGELRTSKRLDHEKEAVHSLLVTVKEQSTADGQVVREPNSLMVSVLVTVHDLNDHEPQFGQNIYHTSFLEGASVSEILEVIICMLATTNPIIQNLDVLAVYGISSLR